MPSAPPTSRVVSLTADPTPALFNGTADMIDPVAGATVMPIPMPSSTRAAAINRYGEAVVTVDMTTKPAATNAEPAVITLVAPIFAAHPALRGDTAISAAASGNVATPASSGE